MPLSIATQLLNALPEPVWVVRRDDHRFLFVNDAAVGQLKYSRKEFLGLRVEDLLQDRDIKRFNSAVGSAKPDMYELLGWVVRCRDGSTASVDVSMSATNYQDQPALVLMPLSATGRQTLEEQLRQSKKLESVGMLAGGIAHDFNNLLTIISGYGQLLMPGLSEHDQSAMEQLLKASDRAAGLTRQLLAYSRRQELQPRVLNLNEVVNDLSPMLRRLIGEHIDVRLEQAPDAGAVHADLGQIEQIIMNLVVNARDAMANGGTLVIETSNVELDDANLTTRMPAKAGQYVMLAVTDTGVGMDPKTAEQVFDPFFTTKGKGQGTGLGLSTVHGILKQSGGSIDLYSEPGRGTSVKVYLPRVDSAEVLPAGDSEAAEELPSSATNSCYETVLVVEDEEAVRKLVLATLERRGYRVLMASSGVEAIHHARNYDGTIHLLITDLVMPQMGGAEVAKRMRRSRPGIGVLCMSGYTDRSIQRTRSIANLDFLQKPFTPNQLLQKVRMVLDASAERRENAGT